MAGLRGDLSIGGQAKVGHRKVTVLSTKVIFPATGIGGEVKWKSCVAHKVRFRDGATGTFISNRDRKALLRATVTKKGVEHKFGSSLGLNV